jgi:hypothetical protein
VTQVNTSKPVEIEDTEELLRISLFLVGVPSDPDGWRRAFDFVSDSATSHNPAARHLAAKWTADGDVVVQATIPLANSTTTMVEDVLDAVDAFIEEADARYEVTNSVAEAARARVQDWWVRRVSRG